MVSASCSSRSFEQPTPLNVAPTYGTISGTVELQSSMQTFPNLLHDVDVVIPQSNGTDLHVAPDSQGTFHSAGMPPGTYSVEVDVNPLGTEPTLFAPRTTVTGVVVVAGKNTAITPDITPTYTVGTTSSAQSQIDLHGTVRADFHLDGGGSLVIDGGFNLSQTTVTVYLAGDESSPFLTTSTSPDGTFGQQLPPGVYDLKATNPQFVPGTELGVVVGPDGGADGGFETLTQDIVMAINPAKLTGTVLLEADPNVPGFNADAGPFVPGAGVAVGTAFGGSGISNAQGVFTVANLLGSADQAFFSASPSAIGETFHTTSPAFAVNLTPGQTTDMGTVQMLLDRGSITGRVKMADGTPAEGVTVSIEGTNFAALVSPELDPSIGDFSFNNVPTHPGYVIQAVAPRYSTAVTSQPIQFSGNGSTTDVGTLVLALLQGDFSINSTNPQSQLGNTNTLSVDVLLQQAPSATQIRIGEAADFSLADGGTSAWVGYVATAPGNPYTLGDSDGIHIVYAQYQNQSGVSSAVLSSSVLVDRQRPTQPSVAVTSGKTFVNQTQGINITLLASDPAESASAPASGLYGMVIAEDYTGADLDGGILPGTVGKYSAYSSYPPNSGVLDAGPYTVYAQFYDNAGNASAIVSSRLVVDVTPPVGSLTIGSLTNSDVGYTSSPLVQVNELFGLVDGGLSSTPSEPFGGTDLVQLGNDANSVVTSPYVPANSQQLWSLDSSGDGQKTVYLILTDSAGNISNNGTPYSASVFLKRTPPLGTVSLIAASDEGPSSVNPTSTNQTQVTLQYTLNGGTPTDPPAVGVEASEQPTACNALPVTSYVRPTGTTATIAYTFAAGGADGGGIQDGNKVIFSCLRDAAGNTTQFETQVVLNRQAPTSSVTVGDGDAYQNDPTAVSINLSGYSSDTTGIAVSTSPLTCATADYQPFSPANPVVPLVSTPTDGAYTIYVCIEDAAGNVTSLPSFSFTEDTVPPTITGASFTTLTGTNATNTPIVGVTFSGFSEPVVAYRLSTSQNFGGQAFINFSADGSAVSGAQQVPYSLPIGDGTKTVYAQVEDRAGNVSTPATALTPVTLIQALPTATTHVFVGAVEDPASTNHSSVTLQFTVSSNVTQVSAASTPQTCNQLPSTSWQNPTGTPPQLPFTLQGSGNPASAQSIFVCFQDVAGNTVSTVNNITYDTQPPTAVMTVGTGNSNQNVSGNVPVVFSAFSSDITGVVVSTGALNCTTATYSAFNSAAPSTTVNVGSTPATDGPYTVSACLKDGAGNVTTLPSFTFTKDTVNPTISGIAFTTLSNAAANVTNQTNVGVTFSGFTGSVVAYRISTDSAFTGVPFTPFAGGSAVSGSQPVAYALTGADGTKTVYAQVSDATGNVSSSSTLTTTLDRTAPSPATATYVGLSTPSGYSQPFAPTAAVTLAVAASDNFQMSPTAALTVAADSSFVTILAGPEAIPGSGQVSFSLPSGDGTKSIFVRFQDSAGNTTLVSAPVTLQSTAPTGTLVISGTLADGSTSTVVTVTNSVSLALTASSTALGVKFGDETLTACPTAASQYVALPTGALAYSMTSAQSPRVVHACLISGSGLTTLISDTINFDGSAPSGCALTLTGVSKNGVAVVAGKTASPTITVGVAGCTGTPTSIAFSTSALTCTGGSVPWQSYAASQSFTLPGSDGSYTVYGCVRDAALNAAATSNTPSMQLIQTAPQASSLLVNGGAAYLNGAQVLANGRTVTVTGAATNAVTWGVAENAAPTSGFIAIGGGSTTLSLSAGDGIKRVYAVFLDAVGNLSSPISTTITVDTVAPAGGSLAVASYQNSGFVSSVSATANLASIPSDATGISLAAITGAACAVGNGLYADGGVNGQLLTPTPVETTLLPSGDGQKVVCAQLIDAAGNGGTVLSGSVTLDTTPPTAPVITTANTTVNTPTGGTFVVHTSAAVTELNFLGYQQEGGQSSTWTTTSNNINTTSFTFNLVGNAPNQLSLRAIDKAGNVSPQSSVFVTSEVTPPSPVIISQTWVANSNASGQVFWQDSTTTNVVGFYVYYDSSSQAGTTNYRGNYATNGASPIFVPINGNTTGSFSLNLQGLTNGSVVYVAVRAVDGAGNVSTAPLSPQEVVLEPNALALNPIASVAESATYSTPFHLATTGDYVFSLYDVPLPDAGGATTLDVIAEGSLASPVETGVIQTSVSPPSVVNSQIFYDAMSYNATGGEGADILIDGPFAYVTSGSLVRILNVTTPSAPTSAAILNFAPFSNYQPNSLAILGDKLFVGLGAIVAPGSYSSAFLASDSRIVTVDLSKLFDRNSATTPTIFADGGGDVTGVQINTNSRSANGVAVYGPNLYFTGEYNVIFKINDAIDNNAGTVWSAADQYRPQSDLLNAADAPTIGGNYLFTDGNGGLSVYDTNSLASDGGLTLLGTSPLGGNGPFNVEGQQAFTSDLSSNGVYSLDVSNPASFVSDGLTTSIPGAPEEPSDSLLLGNYLVEAYSYPATLQFFEVASPVRLNLAAQTRAGAVGTTVGADLIYSGGGQVFDLASTPTLNDVGYPSYSDLSFSPAAPGLDLNCPYDATWFDSSTLVQAQGSSYQPDGGYLTDAGSVSYLAVLDTAGTVNRATVFPSSATQGYVVPLPAGERATGLAQFGNYLVVGEMRNTGLFVEVFDARKLRANHLVGNLAVTDSLGSLQLSTVPDDGTGRLSVSVRQGIAVATFDEARYSPVPSALNGAGAWVVDLRPLMADNASSTLTSADLLATLSATRARGSVIHGTNLYLATATGLSVINIATALSAPPQGTAAVPSSSQIGFVAISDADSLDIWGSYAVVAPQSSSNPSQDGLTAVDISTPSSPFATSYLPLPDTVDSECVPNYLSDGHTSIQVRGSLAYLSGQALTAVVNLR